MERPSLEEVKEYFKNAAVIESVYNTNGIYSDKNIHIDSEAYFCETENKVCLAIWHKKYGYAKILTYKNTEPKFEITKEQVLELSEKFGSDNSSLAKHFLTKHLERMFPEVFQTVLEVGKWYKTINLQSGCLGFSGLGIYTEEKIRSGFTLYVESQAKALKGVDGRVWGCLAKEFVEATTEEVTEALKKEAVKRGIKLGGYIVRDFDDNLKNVVINDESFPNDATWFYHHGNDYLEHYGFVVYSKGQWASVIETKTIQEAEELLKELGHNFKIV